MISVVITTYNSSQFIPFSIDGILRQTFKPRQLIFVDDCSRDDTCEKIQGFAEKFKENNLDYVLIKNKRNEGPSHCRNVGIRLSSQKYIALLDADDIWHPSKLAFQISILENDSSIDLLGCEHNFFADHRSVSNEFKKPITRFWRSRILRVIPFNYFLFKNHFVTPSIVFKKDKNIFFDDTMKFCEDVHFNRLFASKHKVAKLGAALVYVYRPKSHVGLSSNKTQMRRGDLLSLWKLYESGKLNLAAYCASATLTIFKSLVRYALGVVR